MAFGVVQAKCDEHSAVQGPSRQSARGDFLEQQKKPCLSDTVTWGRAEIQALAGTGGRKRGCGGLPRPQLPDDHSSTDFYMPRVGCPRAGGDHSLVAKLSQKKSPKRNRRRHFSFLSTSPSITRKRRMYRSGSSWAAISRRWYFQTSAFRVRRVKGLRVTVTMRPSLSRRV